MKDEFKRETAVDFSVWDINSKWFFNRNKSKDAKMCKRKARRKNKIKLRNEVDNLNKE